MSRPLKIGDDGVLQRARAVFEARGFRGKERSPMSIIDLVARVGRLLRPSGIAVAAPKNTWAVSRDVEQYLERRPRGSLTDADVAAIRAMPGEHFLLQ